MPKAYWIGFIREVHDPDKAAADYALARPAIEAMGGRFIARNAGPGLRPGALERTVIIEFDSVEAAVAAHDSPGYRDAVAALDGGFDREIRIVEALS